MDCNCKKLLLCLFCLCSFSCLCLGLVEGVQAEVTGTVAESEKEELFQRLMNETYTGIPKTLLGDPIFTGSEINAPKVKEGRLFLPFGDDPNAWRAYFDQKIKVDLSGKSEFYLDVIFEDPEAAGGATIYFHSGKGWLDMSGRATKKFDGKSVRYIFHAGSVTKEEDPGGFDTVDTIRVAFFPRKRTNTTVQIEAFYASRSSVAVLFPNFEGSSEPSSIIESTGKIIAKAGISSTLIMEKEATLEKLGLYKIVIIPIAARMGSKMVDILCEYMDQGGFVVAFYSMPEKLMKKMGFSSSHFIPCNPSTVQVARIDFTQEFQEKFAPVMPKSMEQNSYNIAWAKPLDTLNDPFLQKKENRPMIAAWWLDNKGKKTPYPAILWSGRGLYYSHILISDDATNKERFLVSLVNHYDPSVNALLFSRKWQQLFDIGLAPKNADLKTVCQQKTMKIIDELKQKNWPPKNVLQMLNVLDKTVKESNISKQELTQFQHFISTIGTLQEKFSLDYAKKLAPMKVETRFWWEHSGLGPYPGDWDRAMRELSQAGFNGVVSNILSGGSASYNSKLLPQSDRYRQYGDQIEQAVNAAHKYGMELHVWKVNFRAASAPKSFQDQMAAEGRVQKSYGFQDDQPCWLCPSHPKNQDLEVATMLEVAKNYKVDGIHFDYIRFPDSNHCYCEGCKERFSKYCLEKTGLKVAQWPEDTRRNKKIAEAFEQWRCDQITTVVRRVREEVDRAQLKVLISAAVFSSYPGCRQSIGQDWVEWVKRGYLDLIFPMDYTDSAENFEGIVSTQLQNIKGKIPMYPGIGLSVPSYLTADKLAAQIEVTRQLNTGGFCIFDLSRRSIKETVPVMGMTPLQEKAIPFHRAK